MHPVESFMYVSAVLIHFVVPSHLLVFMAHLLTKSAGPAFSAMPGSKRLCLGTVRIENGGEATFTEDRSTTRYFECMTTAQPRCPGTRRFGTFHDGRSCSGTKPSSSMISRSLAENQLFQSAAGLVRSSAASIEFSDRRPLGSGAKRTFLPFGRNAARPNSGRLVLLCRLAPTMIFRLL